MPTKGAGSQRWWQQVASTRPRVLESASADVTQRSAKSADTRVRSFIDMSSDKPGRDMATSTGGHAAEVLGESDHVAAGLHGGHAPQREVRQVGAQPRRSRVGAQLVVALVPQRRAVHHQHATLRACACAAPRRARVIRQSPWPEPS